MRSSGETTQAAAVAGAGEATAPVASSWSLASPLLEAVAGSCAAPSSGEESSKPASASDEAAAAVTSLAEAIAAGFGCMTRPDVADGSQAQRTYVNAAEATETDGHGAPEAASDPPPDSTSSAFLKPQQAGDAAAQPGYGEAQPPPVEQADVAPGSPERMPQAVPAVPAMSPEASVPLRPSRSSKSLLRPIEQKWDHDLEASVESERRSMKMECCPLPPAISGAALPQVATAMPAVDG